MSISYVLFDAANTLIHKPLLWERLQSALAADGHRVALPLLRRNHKLLSECLHFPDRTSQEFYRKFNAELLYSLGIIPTEALLTRIFQSCTYLPWEKFFDSEALHTLGRPLGIVSNFNSTLTDLIDSLYGAGTFRDVSVSEVLGVAKPKRAFYEAALAAAGVAANEILYVGDSVKLDMEPAQALGMHTILIDRDHTFPHFSSRVDSFFQLVDFLA